MSERPENIRRFRLDPDTWRDYGDLVGNHGRSSDLKRYIEWRLDNPDTPLPGQRRGPIRRDRQGSQNEQTPAAA